MEVTLRYSVNLPIFHGLQYDLPDHLAIRPVPDKTEIPAASPF